MLTPSRLAAQAPYPMTPLDLASGLLTGLDISQRPTTSCVGTNVVTELRTVIAHAMVGKQTYVSFSGGRDSSAVLALATDVARRGGQPDPVPLTLRVVGSASADETEWQEMVVRHLRLRDWVLIRVTDELDVLGPVSTRVLQRNGLLYPFNAYFHDLIAEYAENGVLLTGVGGDELLDSSYAHHHARAVLGDARITARVAAGIALSVAAKPLHDLRMAREVPRLAWLRPRAQAAFAWRISRPEPAPVRGWAASMASLLSMRAILSLRLGQNLIGSAHDLSIVNPLLHPAVVGAAMAQGGKAGLGGRTQAMRSITAGLLPDALPARQTKASFEDAVWTTLSRERIRSTQLLEVIADDQQLGRQIDLAHLRAEWQSKVPHAMTALLAQAAYLSALA